MITEDYVSFEVAKLLKEKGFDEYCFAAYSTEIGNFITVGPIKNSEINADKDNTYICTAPTLQMVMKWLREVHNKHIYAVPVVTDDDGVMGYWWKDYIITNKRYNSVRTGKLYNSPEEAYEASIKYCLIDLI